MPPLREPPAASLTGGRWGHLCLQIQPLLPTRDLKYCLEAQESMGHWESWQGLEQSDTVICQNWRCTVKQGSVWETPGCLKVPRSCRVKIYMLKVKRMTAQWRGIHHLGWASAWRQWPPAPAFCCWGRHWVNSRGHAMAWGRRDPSCLYNLGRLEVVALTLWIIKYKPVSAGVTSVVQEVRNSHSNDPCAVQLLKKSAKPRDKITATVISQKVVFGEHCSWISLGQCK